MDLASTDKTVQFKTQSVFLDFAHPSLSQDSSVGKCMDLNLWIAGVSLTAGGDVFLVRAFSKSLTPYCEHGFGSSW